MFDGQARRTRLPARSQTSATSAQVCPRRSVAVVVLGMPSGREMKLAPKQSSSPWAFAPPSAPSGSCQTTARPDGSDRDVDSRRGSHPPSPLPTQVQNMTPVGWIGKDMMGLLCGLWWILGSTKVNHDTCKTPLAHAQGVGPGRPGTEWLFENPARAN